MTYQVIARKWRPQTFEEVTGQEPITRTLENAIEHNRLHHAYLFSGVRGVGKTTTARLFAKALNCHKSSSPTPTPCSFNDPTACASCMEIAEGRSIDVMEIDAASNNSVDNVREHIIGTVGIAPARDRYKVFIIDEVHMLSTSAFNALLKTLEEPPPRVIFILATTEHHKVPETILSRSQQFEFRTIPTARIAERLRLIAEAEKIKISDDALKEIARAGEGSMRDAQSAFDQVISFSGDEISGEDVESALGLTGSSILSRVVDAIASQQSSEVLAVVDDLVMRGHDLRSFCKDLMAHFRDLLVSKVAPDSGQLLDAAATPAEELRRQAELFSETDLVRFFHAVTETENIIRGAAQPRYQLEIGLVRLLEIRRLAPLAEILERLKALETNAPGGSPGSPTNSGGLGSVVEKASFSTRSRSSSARPPRSEASTNTASISPFPTRPHAPQPVTATPSADQAAPVQPKNPSPTLSLVIPTDDNGEKSEVLPRGDSKTDSQVGGTVVQRIKAVLEDRRKMLLVTAIESATRAQLDGDELYFEFAPNFRHLRESLSKPENIKVIREAGREVLGRDIGVRIAVREPGEDGSEPTSAIEVERRERQRLREIAENNPGVQQLLKTFHGEIVDVKKVDN